MQPSSQPSTLSRPELVAILKRLTGEVPKEQASTQQLFEQYQRLTNGGRAPKMGLEAFDRLTKKKMMAELKRVGLAKGRSHANKAELKAVYRSWYQEATREIEARAELAVDEPAVQSKDEAPSAEPAVGRTADRQTPVIPWETRPAAEAPSEDDEPDLHFASLPPAEREDIEILGANRTSLPPHDDDDPRIRFSTVPPHEQAEIEHLGATRTSLPPLDEHAGANRREAPRVELEIDIGYRSETNFFVGFSTDLSDGGLFVATVDLLPLGKEVNVYFVLPGGGDISAEGVVAWVREPRTFDSNMQSGFGIRFTRLSRRDEASIRRYMQVRDPLFHVD